MKQIREKLNSNAGASMILALGLMLVCVIVSSIIVPAAASGLSRNNKRTAQQREYLAISSAAELIVEELKEAGMYVGKEEKHVPGCLDYDPEKNPLVSAKEITVIENGVSTTYMGYQLEAPIDSDAEMSFLLEKIAGATANPSCSTATSKVVEAGSSQVGGKLDTLIKDACEFIILKNSAVIQSSDKYSREFYISVEGETSTDSNSNIDRIPEVKCEFTMDKDYNIEIKISSPSEQNGSVIEGYSVVISMEADEVHKKDVSNSGETTTTTCEIKHKVLNVYAKDDNGDGNADIKVEDYQFIKTNDCSTTEITWHEPVITKGGQ